MCGRPIPWAHARGGDSRAPLTQHVDGPFAAAYIDAMARRVDKHIVGVAAGPGLGHNVSVLAGKRHQGRWAAKDDENPACVAIDRHRKIRSRAFRRQGPIGSCRKVDDLDFTCVGYIDKDPGPGLVDLETFGVAVETVFAGLGPNGRIDDRECALAIADQHAITRHVHAHIVSILAEFDAADRRKILAAQRPHRAVAAIRHIDAVGKGDVGDALRLAEAADRAQHFPSRQADDTEAVVAKLGDEQPPAFHIDTEVIDAAAHLAERNFFSSTRGAPAI